MRQYGRNGLTAAEPYFGALHHQPDLRPAGSFFADLMADFGPDAHETINVLTLGVRLRLTADELDRPLSAYPSGASNIASMLKPSS